MEAFDRRHDLVDRDRAVDGEGVVLVDPHMRGQVVDELAMGLDDQGDDHRKTRKNRAGDEIRGKDRAVPSRLQCHGEDEGDHRVH